MVCFTTLFRRANPIMRFVRDEQSNRIAAADLASTGIAGQIRFRCLPWGKPMTEDRWQELYFDLANEVDSSRLEQKIAEIEGALQERLGEIDPHKDAEEYRLLRRTIEAVNRLKAKSLRLANSSTTQGKPA